MSLQAISVFLGLCVPFLLLTVWAVVNAAQKDFGSIGKKAFWVFVSSIPFIGFVFYLVFGFRKGKRPEDSCLL